MNKPVLYLLCLGGAGILGAGSLQGQISLTGTTYTQNFNSVFNGTANVYAWTDNSTLPGWYGLTTGTSAQYYRSTNANTITPTTTPATPTSLLALRSSTAGSDFALGSVGTAANSAEFGAQFVNNTGATISSLTITYTGEQWGVNTGAATSLDFTYSLDATSLSTGTWTDVSGLDFTALHSGASGGGSNSSTNVGIDGNIAADRTTLTYTLTGLSIANGSTVWIRWADSTTTGLGQALGIDDLSVTAAAVPEPSVPCLLGVFLLGTLAVRWRRSARLAS